MSELRLAIIDKDVPIEDVACGVSSIDSLQKDAFCRTLFKQALAYNIIVDKCLVGTCMIKLVRLCDANKDYCVGEPECVALEITYIAVGEKYQNKRIGTNVLNLLILRARKWSTQLPIRFLIIDSLPDKEQWYTLAGFRRYPKREDLRRPGTVPMLIDLMDTKAAEQYAASYC